MAFLNIEDINSEIFTWIVDFKLFVNLSILDKKSYALITNSLIYKELGILRNHNIKSNKKNIPDKYYELGLINILTNLNKNNEHFYLKNAIDWASENGHINILDW